MSKQEVTPTLVEGVMTAGVANKFSATRHWSCYMLYQALKLCANQFQRHALAFGRQLDFNLVLTVALLRSKSRFNCFNVLFFNAH